MNSRGLIISVAIALAGFLPQTQGAAILGWANNFAVLGASTVTSTGDTVLYGDLGVSPGTAITGFPPGLVVNGAIHSADSVAAQAQAAALTAYTSLAGEPVTGILTGENLGGLTLTPGVYFFSSSADLTGILTLSGTGRFDFLIGSTLTTASSASVLLINGAHADNVFWQVGSSATLGTDTQFSGTILAEASITLATGADLSGRALALTGAVTLDHNIIRVPTPTLVPEQATLWPAAMALLCLASAGIWRSRGARLARS